MKNKIYEVIGWVGTAMIIFAYLLVSFGLLSPESISYQLLNLVGAGGVLIIGLFRRIYQTVVIEAFWIAIAFFALLKIFKLI